MRELDPLVSEYQHDKHRPREAEALLTLRKVASLVKPIMRQRMWRVGTLCEFYPSTQNLLGLNVNHGQKICLRLRQPYDERQFLPIEQVVDTMLHELCHIVHGPHDQKFHALWNQLRDEHEQLISSGYTGEGFLSAGHRLGGRRIPMDEARRLARAAAEKRRVLSSGTGKKLGGGSVLPGTDMRNVLADAAERRATVTKGCASGTIEGDRLAEEATRNGFRTKAEMEDANERAIMEAYIDLIQQEEREQYGDFYTPPSSSNPLGPRASTSSGPNPIATSSKPQLTESTTCSSSSDVMDSEPWTCSTCTFINRPLYLTCEVCSAERTSVTNSLPSSRTVSKLAQEKKIGKQPYSSGRHGGTKSRKSAVQAIIELEKNQPPPPKRSLGWVCHCCGAFMESQWWTCSACGTMKLSD
ncbi:zinc ion binding protein [Nannizzia gypsea CBS 118893]|uniref:Zinc ion binding protein n=1 Tax=Arthroderma gypseum (strain ATCC MYA-4604 / CBS 118893) TaxID=535722 RepID=E4UPH1_ARTGP|nr:zinc ion binding protein [Nannizzia gypsea CBS 118893]EFQ99846.1 zinc ion binding protein [Nannizzia gypsea CBS 118893]